MQKQHDETPKGLVWNILAFKVESFIPNKKKYGHKRTTKMIKDDLNLMVDDSTFLDEYIVDCFGIIPN